MTTLTYLINNSIPSIFDYVQRTDSMTIFHLYNYHDNIHIQFVLPIKQV